MDCPYPTPQDRRGGAESLILRRSDDKTLQQEVRIRRYPRPNVPSILLSPRIQRHRLPSRLLVSGERRHRKQILSHQRSYRYSLEEMCFYQVNCVHKIILRLINWSFVIGTHIVHRLWANGFRRGDILIKCDLQDSGNAGRLGNPSLRQGVVEKNECVRFFDFGPLGLRSG